MSFDFCIITKRWPRVYVNYFGPAHSKCVCELLAALGDGKVKFFTHEFS